MGQIIQFPMRSISREKACALLKTHLSAKGVTPEAAEAMAATAIELLEEASQVVCQSLQVQMPEGVEPWVIEAIETGLSAELMKYQQQVVNLCVKLVARSVGAENPGPYDAS